MDRPLKFLIKFYSLSSYSSAFSSSVRILQNPTLGRKEKWLTKTPVAFFKSKFITVVATAGTALLSLSFVFAVTTQEFLGSCIFLFVKHPYDVGDRVDISGIKMTVDRISLLYTVFTRIDQMQVVQASS